VTLIDQVMDALVAIVAGTPEAVGGVFEDRPQPFTVGQDQAIEVTLRDADSQTLGDDHPLRSVLRTTLQVELAVYSRAAINEAGQELPTRRLTNPLWAAAHVRLMADPSLGGLAVRVRWRRCSWRRENADGTAGWAVHSYEIALAMREHNLLAP
jgi:hypothetical protein